MKLIRLLPFFFLLLSSVAFSLTTLLSRLFLPEKLPLIIDFQSTSVFLVFILQMGLRTGIRLHYHSGYKRTVDRVYSSVNTHTLGMAFLFSFFTFWVSKSFFFSFCFSQAILSFNQGLFVARKEFNRVVYSSIIIFLQIITSVVVIVFVESSQLAFLIIESSSLIMVFLFRFIFSIRPGASFNSTFLLIKKYFPLQIGSFVVYGAMYFFAQCIIKYGEHSKDLVLAYADATIVAGVILLLAGKGIVFIEGKIIKEKKYFINLLYYLIFVMVTTIIYAFVVSSFMSYGPYWAIGSMLFLLGRFSFSYVSQFSNSKSRILLYSMGSLITLILLMFNYLNFSYSVYETTIMTLNLNIAVVLFVLFYRFNSKKMFI